jgi:transcriptional regulator with XRE-family HTH domain
LPIVEIPPIADETEIECFLKTISENIKRIRMNKGISQFDLALTIGQKGSGFFACAENCTKGKRFNLIQLYKIAKALEVPIEEFFKNNSDTNTNKTKKDCNSHSN